MKSDTCLSIRLVLLSRLMALLFALSGWCRHFRRMFFSLAPTSFVTSSKPIRRERALCVRIHFTDPCQAKHMDQMLHRLSLPLSLPLSLSVCLSVSLCFSLCLCLSVSICLWVSLRLSLLLCLQESLSLSVFVSLCVSVFVSLPVCLSPFLRLSLPCAYLGVVLRVQPLKCMPYCYKSLQL